jgi:pyruvate ferredoxin oxidoreductase gamma subunit
MHCPVTHPRVVSVVDATLLDSVNVAEGTTEDAIFVVNTTKDPQEIRQKLGAKPTQKVFTVDATGISVQEIGRALPNSPMLGAVVRATALVSLEHLLEEVRKSFGKKFSEKIITGNLKAVERGYKEVQEG